MKYFVWLSLILAVATFSTTAGAQQQSTSSTAAAAAPNPAGSGVSASATATVHADDPARPAAGGIPVGTVITMQNWRQYQDYMSAGMVALFSGTYFWKMPADVSMEVGPTIVNPTPKNYLAATEKYSGQVKIVELPDGGLTLTGYHGGLPFPNPQEPHKGWKILADVWYRYIPHFSYISHASGCTINSTGNINCSAGNVVYRQLSYNTDPGTTNTVDREGRFYTQWFMILEPEQERYTASLTIAFNDLKRQQELYAFIPSLRRYQPVSAAARCGQTSGMDINEDDYRSGFNANLTQFKVDYLGSKKVLALMLSEMPPDKFPEGYDMPLGWPKPSWGKWQVRDVDVISAAKVPNQSAGYCYGKRVMYVDRPDSAPLWEELYDPHDKLWKIGGLFLHTVDVPNVGPVDSSGSLIYAFWDIQNKHGSIIADPTDSKYPFYVNEQVPKDFRDITRYSTPGGLNMIMR
jgi:Protein of unknown function (DUF1329)